MPPGKRITSDNSAPKGKSREPTAGLEEDAYAVASTHGYVAASRHPATPSVRASTLPRPLTRRFRHVENPGRRDILSRATLSASLLALGHKRSRERVKQPRIERSLLTPSSI